jgi:hypothetical protein
VYKFSEPLATANPLSSNINVLVELVPWSIDNMYLLFGIYFICLPAFVFHGIACCVTLVQHNFEHLFVQPRWGWVKHSFFRPPVSPTVIHV